jgi:hypothetical protein
MSGTDQRYIPGAIVNAKAVQVTNLAECSRRYGCNAKTKRVVGKVVSTEFKSLPGNTRKSCFVTADYELGGGVIKTCILNLRSVVAGDLAPSIETTGTQLGTQSTFAVATTEMVTPTITNVPEQQQHDNEQNNTEFDTIITPQQLHTTRLPEILPLLSEPNPPPMLPTAPSLITTPLLLITSPLLEGDIVDDVHGQLWHKVNNRNTGININGLVRQRQWAFRNALGEPILPTNMQTTRIMSRLDFFMLMFPPKQLTDMLTFTNVELTLKRKAPTTKGEILKLFGVMILMTTVEFTSRASLWATVAVHKYQPAPSFGKTGMSRNRFDELFSALRWSSQPATRPIHMSSKAYRWMLVDGFISNFNDYRAENFIPSELICVDESISRWYGQGGSWINHGLPMYVAIDRKPENGCEIQNSACGKSGVMLRLNW